MNSQLITNKFFGLNSMLAKCWVSRRKFFQVDVALGGPQHSDPRSSPGWPWVRKWQRHSQQLVVPKSQFAGFPMKNGYC